MNFLEPSTKQNPRTREIAKLDHLHLAGAMAVALMGFFCLVIGGCGTGGGGGTSSQNTGFVAPPPPQTLTVFLRDDPSDQAIALKLDVNSIGVTDSLNVQQVLSTSTQHFELGHLALAPTLAATSKVNAGSYTSVTLTFNNQQLQTVDSMSAAKVLDSNSTPSFKLGQTTLTLPINFTVATSAHIGLLLDLNLPKSLSTDAVTSNITFSPSATIVQTSANDVETQLTASTGTVSAVTTNPNAFDVQLFDSGSTAHILTDSNTLFDTALSQFGSIKVGQVIEVNAFFQADGTFLARTISSGATSQAARTQGVVVNAVTDSSGMTTIDVIVQQ